MTVETQSRWALIVLATIAAFAALWVAQPIFAPLALAFVLAVILSPLSDFWQRLGIPIILSSLLNMILGLALLTGLGIALQPLAADVYEQAPRIKSELRGGISTLQNMVQGLDEVSDEVERAITPDDEEGSAEKPAAEPVGLPQMSELLVLAPAIAGQILVFAGGLYFFLLCRNSVYLWLATFSGRSDADAVEVFRRADRLVARYSVTIALINTAFGVSVGIALQLVGMPGAIVWAFVGAIMNFVMYLGPAIVAAALLVAGHLVFDGLYSFVPAAVFVTLNAIEGQFVTPTLVGRHLHVNPLLVFLSLCLWLWLWGPIGGIVAIPLLVWALAVSKGLGLGEAPVEEQADNPPKLIEVND